jgi:hypothetical protein
MERDASLAMIKEDGKMLHACLALRLIASMSFKAREDLNLWKSFHDHFLIYAVNIR